MPDYADLEIGLHRRDAENYVIELRFSQPESDADTRLLQTTPVLQFDFDALREYSLNDVRYGQLLAEQLFADPDARERVGDAVEGTPAPLTRGA